MIRQILYPVVEFDVLRMEMTEEESQRFDELTPEEKTAFIIKNVKLEKLQITYQELIEDFFRAGGADMELQKGVCKECGCTEEDGCYHPEYGGCYWVDKEMNLCSHCADPQINMSENRVWPQGVKKPIF